jgi:cobalt-zinc-cadmium efflux system membrane fusion protein
VVEPASEQEIDDTLVTSGRVTFEDIKVGHVFSPVTGRVARIDVELGAAREGRAALAVIQSPDIGQAPRATSRRPTPTSSPPSTIMQREKELLDKNATSQKDYEAAEDAYRQARAEKQRALQKAFLLRTGGGRHGHAGLRPGRAARRRGARPQPERRHRGARPVQRRHPGALHGRRARRGLGARRPLRDRSRARADRRQVHSCARSRTKTRPSRGRSTGSAACSTRPRARPRSAARSPTPSTFSSRTCTRPRRSRSRRARRSRSRRPRSCTSATRRSYSSITAPAEPDGKHHFERVPVAVDEALGGRWLPVLHGLNPGDNVVTQGSEALESKI